MPNPSKSLTNLEHLLLWPHNALNLFRSPMKTKKIKLRSLGTQRRFLGKNLIRNSPKRQFKIIFKSLCCLLLLINLVQINYSLIFDYMWTLNLRELFNLNLSLFKFYTCCTSLPGTPNQKFSPIFATQKFSQF